MKKNYNYLIFTVVCMVGLMIALNGYHSTSFKSGWLILWVIAVILFSWGWLSGVMTLILEPIRARRTKEQP